MKHYRPSLNPKSLYSNCAVYDPNGILMFRTSHKRAHWYLNRKLATIVSTDPLSIQLTFSPKGKGHAGTPDEAFYLEPRKNICVVCGSDQRLTKHHVVPYRYRKHFPNHMKNRMSYDVLLLCSLHHNEYEKLAREKEKELSSRYGIVEKTSKKIHPGWVYSHANALVRHSASIPASRIKEIKNKLERYLKTEITEEILDDFLSRPSKKLDQGEIAKKVVEKLPDIIPFIEEWRYHFISTMTPKYLSNNWKIKN